MNEPNVSAWPNNLGWNVGKAGEVWRLCDGRFGVRTFRDGAGHRCAVREHGGEPDADALRAWVAECRRSGALIVA